MASRRTSGGRPAHFLCLPGATWGNRHNAALLVDVLRSCVAAGRFDLHDFVIMPNHLHLLLTVSGETTIEKAMQFIKGGFSFRLGRETGHKGEVWQRGYSELRVNDKESFENHRHYIAQNPVKAGLTSSPEEFKWCFTNLARAKASRGANGREAERSAQGLKPGS
jgi:putative transposase